MSTAPTPGLFFISSGGATKEVFDLTGKNFNSIGSSDEGVLAACEEGLFSCSTAIDEVEAASPTNASSEAKISIASLASQDFVLAASGKGFIVAVDKSSSIYTWGSVGAMGQLGQGACHQDLSEPKVLKHNSNFVGISCGDAFSLAVDDGGNAYSWGENFDRQLGLYNKSKANMHLQNAMVEDLSFVPRLLPLSLKQQIVRIACGLRFAMAVVKGGHLYSWGAGECGQLGTGRCTRKELPSLVTLPSTGSCGDAESKELPASDAIEQPVPLLVSDVACGAGHVVALAADEGLLYSWGLNKSGQLGVGDTLTRHHPAVVDCVLPSIEGEQQQSSVLKFEKVFAHGHSSAGIDSSGKLFTWGSTAHNRLMQPLPLRAPAEALQAQTQKLQQLQTVELQSVGTLSRKAAANAADAAEAAVLAKMRPLSLIERPTRVCTEHLKEEIRISSFAFARNCSAALVGTTIHKVSPTEGPKRSFSKMKIFGDGFWNSPSIVVKFTFHRPLSTVSVAGASSIAAGVAGDAHAAQPSIIPPRSCTGTYVSSGVLVCKPPKFSDVGVYRVTVSMDGSRFLAAAALVVIHKELSVQKQSPDLFDVTHEKSIVSLKLRVAGLAVSAEPSSRSYYVKLTFGRLRGSARPGTSSGVVTSPRVTSSSTTSTATATAAEPTDLEIIVQAVLQAPGAEDSAEYALAFAAAVAEGAPPPSEDDVSTLICSDVDLTPLLQSGDNPLHTGKEQELFEMRCAVSLNGQDYSGTGRGNTRTSMQAQAQTGTAMMNVVGSASLDGNAGAGPALSAAAAAPSGPTTLLYAFSPTGTDPCCSPLDLLLPATLNATQLDGLRAASFSSKAAGSAGFAAVLSSSSVDSQLLALGVGEASLRIQGSSFIPSHRLPKDSQLEARLTPILQDMIVCKGGIKIPASELAANEALLSALQTLPPICVSAFCSAVNSISLNVSGVALLPLQQLLNEHLFDGDVLAGDEDDAALSPMDAADEGAVTPSPFAAQNITIDYLPLQVYLFLQGLHGPQGQAPPAESTSSQKQTSQSSSVTLKQLYPSPHLEPHSSECTKPKELVLNFYRSHSISIAPNCAKAVDAAAMQEEEEALEAPVSAPAHAKDLDHQSQRFCILLQDGAGFSFSSSAVCAHLHVPQLPDSDDDAEAALAPGRDGMQYHEALTLPQTCIQMHELQQQQQVDSDVAELNENNGSALGASGGVRTENKSSPQEFWVEVELQPIAYYLDLLGYKKLFVPHVCLSISLDGCTVPPQEEWCMLTFCRSLARYSLHSPAAAPKGGFTAGTVITLKLDDFCPIPDAAAAETLFSLQEAAAAADVETAASAEGRDGDEDAAEEDPSRAPISEQRPPLPPMPQSFVVRLRGAPTDDMPDGATVPCPAELSVEDGDPNPDNEISEKSSILSFSIPAGVLSAPGMAPVLRGKDKLFYADISMDNGVTFDCADSALLQLK